MRTLVALATVLTAHIAFKENVLVILSSNQGSKTRHFIYKAYSFVILYTSFQCKTNCIISHLQVPLYLILSGCHEVHGT